MISLWATLAIVGATVHPGDGPPIEGATVLIEGGRISAVGADLTLPAGATVIDGEGKVVTPGLIDPFTGLGLLEIRLIPETVDRAAAASDPIRAAFDAADAFNPFSAVIPIQRDHGITSVVSVPVGGLISGQGRAFSLGQTPAPIEAPGAMVVSFGGRNEGSRGTQTLRLLEALDEAAFFAKNEKAWLRREVRDLALSARDLSALGAVIEGRQPLLVEVDRRADLLAVLRLAERAKAPLKIIIASGAEAWLEAPRLAKAGVPVIVDPSVNQPDTMDRVHAREDNAARLHEAGVPVMLSTFSVHNVRKLRQWAGNAVRAGLSHEAALRAITATPAAVFGLKGRGVIREGAVADVVVWTGDPFELSTHADVVIVGGEVMSEQSRQEALMQRYR